MFMLSVFIICIGLVCGIPAPQQYDISGVSNELEDEAVNDRLAEYLVYLLGADETEMPLVLIQDDLPSPQAVLTPMTGTGAAIPGSSEIVSSSGAASNSMSTNSLAVKRSRYYRRYPWKRQNGRHYDADGYLCAPSREDVFQLLMALHDARSGQGDRTISFCNRRRPARAVFTNIRFLG